MKVESSPQEERTDSMNARKRNKGVNTALMPTFPATVLPLRQVIARAAAPAARKHKDEKVCQSAIWILPGNRSAS
jgi:hypothetical protein